MWAEGRRTPRTAGGRSMSETRTEETQASFVSPKDVNEHWQKEIHECKGFLQNATENPKQDIEETIKCKEKILADLQYKVQSTADVLRRSERIKMQTEKKCLLIKGKK